LQARLSAAHREPAALARAFAFGVDPACVHLDQAAYERQADAEPALVAPRALAAAEEHLEEVRQGFGRDAVARVGDAHHRLEPFGARLDADRAPVLGVFRGVVDEIA
jgi:hypothetical protein